MSVLNIGSARTKHTDSLAFLDPNGGVTIQRYEEMRYPQFDRLTETQLSFFWRPQEIDILRDKADFKALTEAEKHIFISNLQRQIVLDSLQGRSPSLALLPVVSLPEIEAWVQAWTFSEMIHSRSYTHIIRNVFADPSVVFDEIMTIEPIVDCARDISQHYDRLITLTQWYNLLGPGQHMVNGNEVSVDLKDIKRALWMTLMSVNILEGIRFYISFACSWAFAEMKKMEGNAKIIKLIAKDEALHLASTQSLLKILVKEDPDYVTIAAETRDECIALFRAAVDQEKQWAKFLFKNGSMIGLSETVLCDYAEWIGNKRLAGVGLPSMWKIASNPLPWTQRWISGGEVQIAPQQAQISSYQIGSIKKDVTETSFKGFKL